MPARFVNTIIFVENIERSKKFYSETLKIAICEDHGTVVFFENHLVLHCARSILDTVYQNNALNRNWSSEAKTLLVYFECESLPELEILFSQLHDKVHLIHGIESQAWGQKVFRFYDPDGHIVEFGEPLRN